MKKLYVNCPVKGRKWDDVVKSIEKMHKIAEIVFEEELEVIDTLSIGNLEEEDLYSLAKHIEKLAEADYVVNIRDFDGCFWHQCYLIEMIAVGFSIRKLDVYSADVAPDLREVMNDFYRDEIAKVEDEC